MNLTAVRALDEVLRRHVLESLEALDLLGTEPRDHLVDLGSGAGYPALPLLMVRDTLTAQLIEAREKRCAFLRAVLRETALDRRALVEQQRLAAPSAIPDTATIVTLRAFPQPARWIRGAFERPRVRLLAAWLGARDAHAIAASADDRVLRAQAHPSRARSGGALLVVERR